MDRNEQRYETGYCEITLFTIGLTPTRPYSRLQEHNNLLCRN